MEKRYEKNIFDWKLLHIIVPEPPPYQSNLGP